MKTHVDTNILISLLSGDEEEVAVVQAALENAAERGILAVSPVVYAELVAGNRGPGEVETFLDGKEIEVVWNTNQNIWREAGIRYGRHARNRRRQEGDSGPRRILADFLVGAHALHPSRTLLTSDAGIFRTYFPELEIVTPEGVAR